MNPILGNEQATRVDTRWWGKLARVLPAASRVGDISVQEKSLSARPTLRYRRRHLSTFTSVVWFMSATLLWLCALAGVSDANAAAFVQVSAATPQSKGSQVTVTYAQAQVAGDANVVAIGW